MKIQEDLFHRTPPNDFFYIANAWSKMHPLGVLCKKKGCLGFSETSQEKRLCQGLLNEAANIRAIFLV